MYFVTAKVWSCAIFWLLFSCYCNVKLWSPFQTAGPQLKFNVTKSWVFCYKGLYDYYDLLWDREEENTTQFHLPRTFHRLSFWQQQAVLGKTYTPPPPRKGKQSFVLREMKLILHSKQNNTGEAPWSSGERQGLTVWAMVLGRGVQFPGSPKN